MSERGVVFSEPTPHEQPRIAIRNQRNPNSGRDVSLLYGVARRGGVREQLNRHPPRTTPYSYQESESYSPKTKFRPRYRAGTNAVCERLAHTPPTSNPVYYTRGASR